MGGIEITGEASITQAEKETQQENLFGKADVSEHHLAATACALVNYDRLSHEFNAIGFFSSSADDYKSLLQRARVALLRIWKVASRKRSWSPVR